MIVKNKMKVKFSEAVMDFNNTRGGLLDKFEDATPDHELKQKKLRDKEVPKLVHDPIVFQNGLQEGDKNLNTNSAKNMYDYSPNISWAGNVTFKNGKKDKGLKVDLNEIGKSLTGKITDEYVNKLDIYSDKLIIK